jgi:hypothetical protein
MKLIRALWLLMWLTPVVAQNSATHKMNQVMTFSYSMDSSGIMYLSSATLPPGTQGRVAVDRGSVATSIDVEVDHIPPAQNLGANSGSYVVWLISPDGEIRNVGELTLNGDTGMLQTTTNWVTFGIFVTAEPDNCVCERILSGTFSLNCLSQCPESMQRQRNTVARRNAIDQNLAARTLYSAHQRRVCRGGA